MVYPAHDGTVSFSVQEAKKNKANFMTVFGSLGLALSYGLGAQVKTTASEHWRVYIRLGKQGMAI